MRNCIILSIIAFLLLCSFSVRTADAQVIYIVGLQNGNNGASKLSSFMLGDSIRIPGPGVFSQVIVTFERQQGDPLDNWVVSAPGFVNNTPSKAVPHNAIDVNANSVIYAGNLQSGSQNLLYSVTAHSVVGGEAEDPELPPEPPEPPEKPTDEEWDTDEKPTTPSNEITMAENENPGFAGGWLKGPTPIDIQGSVGVGGVDFDPDSVDISGMRYRISLTFLKDGGFASTIKLVIELFATWYSGLMVWREVSKGGAK